MSRLLFKAAVVVLEPVLEAFVRIEKILADQADQGSLGTTLEVEIFCKF